MTVKQLEKQLEKLRSLHEENILYWTEEEAELSKTLDSLQNHSEQIQTFSKLQLPGNLEITRQFPDIKDQLLQKLSNLSSQFECRLSEYHQTLSQQRDGIAEISELCSDLSSSLPVPTLLEVRPAELCLAHRLEQSNQLVNIYNSVEVGLSSWLEFRHRQREVWGIKAQLSLLTL